MDRPGGRLYLDNLYDDYGLCVELDGQEAHRDDRRWLGIRRANAVVEQGASTLRYGRTDVNSCPCLTAVQVGNALAKHGCPGNLRPCGTGCAIPRTVRPTGPNAALGPLTTPDRPGPCRTVPDHVAPGRGAPTGTEQRSAARAGRGGCGKDAPNALADGHLNHPASCDRYEC